MSNPIPNLLALTSIADGSPQQAAPIRNNYAAIQAAVNALATALKGGTAGSLLYATDLTDVAYLPDAPADGQALIWNAAASRWKPGSVAGTSYRKTTAKTVNTTVAETDLLNGEITVGAGVLGTTGMLRLTAWGDWLQNSGGSATGPQRFKLKLGATTIFDTGAPAAGVGASATRGSWGVEATIANAGAANSQTATLRLRLAASSGQFTAFIGALTAGEGGYGSSGNYAYVEDAFATAAVDTTASSVLALTVINPSASASYETKLYGALIEIL